MHHALARRRVGWNAVAGACAFETGWSLEVDRIELHTRASSNPAVVTLRPTESAHMEACVPLLERRDSVIRATAIWQRARFAGISRDRRRTRASMDAR